MFTFCGRNDWLQLWLIDKCTVTDSKAVVFSPNRGVRIILEEGGSGVAGCRAQCI